jgi:hypothetical protein
MRLNSEHRRQIFAAVLKVFDRSRMLTECVGHPFKAFWYVKLRVP